MCEECPVNTKYDESTIYHNKYKANSAKTERYGNSAIPNLQRLLNEHEQERNQMLKWGFYLCISELCHTSLVFLITVKLYSLLLYYYDFRIRICISVQVFV